MLENTIETWREFARLLRVTLPGSAEEQSVLDWMRAHVDNLVRQALDPGASGCAYENDPAIWRHYARIIRQTRSASEPEWYILRDIPVLIERMTRQAQGDLAYGKLIEPESWALIRQPYVEVR
jgi:hypothetical protein